MAKLFKMLYDKHTGLGSSEADIFFEEEGTDDSVDDSDIKDNEDI